MGIEISASHMANLALILIKLDDNDEGEDEDPFAMLEEGLEELGKSSLKITKHI